MTNRELPDIREWKFGACRRGGLKFPFTHFEADMDVTFVHVFRTREAFDEFVSGDESMKHIKPREFKGLDEIEEYLGPAAPPAGRARFVVVDCERQQNGKYRAISIVDAAESIRRAVEENA